MPYAGNPSTSDTDAVRFLVGDTDLVTELFNDDEINWAIGQEENIYLAACIIAEARINEILAASGSGVKRKKIGALEIEYGALEDYAASLQEKIPYWKSRGLVHQSPSCGGISIDDKRTVELDVDRVVPFFERDQFRHPGLARRNVLEDVQS